MSKDRDPFQLIGTSIEGKYRVDRLVGEGGFGVVYRGEHVGFGAPIAIKCLKLPPYFDEEAQAELVRSLREEGRLLLKLSQRSSSIVQALDVGTVVGRSGAVVPYLVLEWLAGRTLAEDLKERIASGLPARTLSEAIALLDPAARALAIAHQEKIAHRDIKPENLFLVDVDGETAMKILDFGIAKVFAEVPAPSNEATVGVSAYTPAYAAPEQFERKRGASGPWTDVFAFTLVLIEVMAQRRALEGDDLAVLYANASDPTSRPTLAKLGLPTSPALERVLRRGLSVEPSERYPDLKRLWDDVVAAAKEDALGAAATVLHDSAPAQSRRGAHTATAPIEPIKIPEVPQSRVAARRSKGWLLGGGVALMGVVVALALGNRNGGAPPTEASSAATQAPSSSTGPLPSAASAAAPRARSPEIEALFREAERAWHDGDDARAIGAMNKAVAKDPELGSAHLRLALWQFEGAVPKAREAFADAGRLRATLDEKDSELYAAARALFAQPWDLASWERDLTRLAERYPDDAEVLLYLGHAQKARLSFEAAVKTFDRVLAIDPELVPARLLKADALSMKGDGEQQIATYRECLQHAPAAVGCQEQLVLAYARAGRCDDMLREAKQFAAEHAKLTTPHQLLADALAATGAPKESVLEAINKGIELLPAERRVADELELRSALATLSGDFAGAEAILKQWEAEVDRRSDQLSHAMPAIRRARLYLEIDQPKRAGAVAEAIMKRMGAWSEPSGGDLTMNLLPFMLRGEQLSSAAFDEKRNAWIERVKKKWVAAGRDVGNDFEWITWSTAYGNAIETRADAELAISKMPATLPHALATGRWLVMDYNIGRAYALAGRGKDALAPLSRASQSCIRLTEPTLPSRATLVYGIALESTGDSAGARAAYERVLAAWGNAKPPSVSAKEAKRRIAGLR